MKSEKLLDAFGKIDDDLIIGALNDTQIRKKNVWLKLGSIAAVLTFFIGISILSIHNWNNHAIANSIIILDVNPSIALTVDANEKIVTAEGLNEDGNIVLNGMELVGVDMEVAVNAIIGSMLQKGYLSELQNTILVSVENSDIQKSSELQKRVSSMVGNTFQYSTFDGSVLSQSINSTAELEQMAQEFDISLGKAALIQEVAAQDSTLSVEKLTPLSITEIALISQTKNLIPEAVTQYGDASDKAYISWEAAIEIAYRHAGVNAEEVADAKTEFDIENETVIYEIDFHVGTTEYEYSIDARTGQVLEYEISGKPENSRDQSSEDFEILDGVLLKYHGSGENVTIPQGVTSIGDSAFCRCDSLVNVTIPKGVMDIGYAAFYNCKSLTKVTIPKSVTSIGDSAFAKCSSLASVTIPKNVVSIGDSAFLGCSSLARVTIQNGVVSIGERAFCWCDNLIGVTIPESVASIGDYAFQYCTSLAKITIPKGLTSIGCDAFSDTPWLSNQQEKNLVIENGILIDGKACSGAVTIPEGVTSIGDYAFNWCSDLTSVTIPGSVTSIGDSAFHSCRNLTSVTISEGVENIGYAAFAGCDSLVEVTIPKSVTSIGDAAFDRCSSLASITIPEGMTSIGYCVFFGCSSLASVTIPEEVTDIGDYAFAWCSSLAKVTIPESVTNIGDYAFYMCTDLASVTIPEEITNIGGNAFSNTSWLSNQQEKNPFVVVNGVLIDGRACVGEVTIPEGVVRIGNDAFSWCESIVRITIPEGVTSIGEDAFYGSSLTSITIPKSVTVIEERAFGNFHLEEIQGEKDSYAQEYAEKYGFQFVEK